VAKEFLAARRDERGVLILSQFTGAALELPDALLINPYDIDHWAGSLITELCELRLDTTDFAPERLRGSATAA
jgi:hypothetical protein